MKRALVVTALALVAACRPPSTVGVKPQLVPPTGDQDFGVVPVLNQKSLDIPILNVGRGDLELKSVTLKDPGIFTLVSAPSTIVAGETANVVVKFVPLKEQDYSDTLVLESNDEANPIIEVKLLGKGSTRALMQVDPMVLDFGRVAECSSVVKTFTITNKGTADLIVEELSFTDGSSPAFAFVGSSKTPAIVKFKDPNGLPGKIQLTVKFTVAAGSMGAAMGSIKIRGTDPDNREVLLMLKGDVNRAPVPVIAPLGNGAPGLTVTLDGSGSSDPDADNPITFKWTMRSKPLSSDTDFLAATSAMTSMRLDPLVPGAYEVQLDVTDALGVKNCQPARATVVATPAQKLLVEMFWDNAKTDIDLHVLRTPTSKLGMAPDDAYYANPAPEWGQIGANDDPIFIRDALTGYGPELFGYVNPIDTTYRLVAEFANEHLDPNPKSKVTVRIYLYGVVKGEFTRTLEKAGNRWIIADVAWPSGDITAQP
ncbi:MAG: hypothetical protein H6Q89_2222 [Myxococcaceae bacterium]|nr:hypothetical protein [Myxococcaceae bacterium]